MNSNSDILYVTVLYKQRLEETSAFKTLLHDRAHVYIQDNSPEPIIPDSLPAGWKYVSASSNPGLSAAYNAAARFAMEKGLKWLMITDQDTIYPEGAASVYETLPQRFPEEKIFFPKVVLPNGMYISPVSKRHYLSSPQPEPLKGHVELSKSAIINSGLLINLAAFEESGGYNEKVFLDFSDFQFIDCFSQICPTGYVVDEEIRQSFSAVDDKGDAQLKRFLLFCKSLNGYDKRKLRTRIGIGLVVLKRCLSLTLRLRTFDAIKIFIKNYMR